MVLEYANKEAKAGVGAVGRHLLVEMKGCNNLNDQEIIREMLKEAVEACNATLIGVEVHKFNPHGVSGMAIIGESHLSIHTWPEFGYAAVDIFTCGSRVDPYDALPVFKKVLKPREISVIEIRRGLLEGLENNISCERK